MKLYKNGILLVIALVLSLIAFNNSYSGPPPPPSNLLFFSETDAGADSTPFGYLAYFFDLRERETFIQLTYPAIDQGVITGSPALAHIQIFDVANNCNENDFFDRYTVSDTHIYNMRDIQTNDGNPSGVVLPDGAYGMVVIYIESDFDSDVQNPFGNMRIIDNNGYEYRTNAQTARDSGAFTQIDSFIIQPFYTFNFNIEEGVTFSDVIGVTFLDIADGSLAVTDFVDASDVGITFQPFDVDIFDENENVFSCRNVIFSCVDQDNPRLEELLENAGTASVASFEYGINEAIPHTKGGELLCPGNTIPEGIARLTPLDIPGSVIQAIDDKFDDGLNIPYFYGFIGLNNGNGRGSFESFFYINTETNEQL